MESTIDISLKRLAAFQLANVQAGQMDRVEAEAVLKQRIRYSSRVREDIVEGLTREYDPVSMALMEYFKLI